MVLSATRVGFPSDRHILPRQYAGRDSISAIQGIVKGHRVHDELGCRCPLEVSIEMGRTDEYRIATATNHGGRITNLQPLASISPILSLSRDPRTRDCVFHCFPGYGTMVLSGPRPRYSPRHEASNRPKIQEKLLGFVDLASVRSARMARSIARTKETRVVSQQVALERILDDESATDAFAKDLAAALTPGIVIGLIGDLGAGKTRLVRSCAIALGADPERINSPTFVLRQGH